MLSYMLNLICFIFVVSNRPSTNAFGCFAVHIICTTTAIAYSSLQTRAPIITNRVIISHPEDASMFLYHADMLLIDSFSMPFKSFLSNLVNTNCLAGLDTQSVGAHTRSNREGTFEENARSSNISEHWGMYHTAFALWRDIFF